MKILALPRYAPLGASSRLRVFQYLPYLRENGLEIQVEPLLGNGYVRGLYTGGKKARADVFQSYGRRIRLLAGARKYDLIWMEKELLPFLPPWSARWLNRIGVPYAVDYDDATFHQYDQNRRAIVRRLLGTKIAEIMRRSAVVLAGNDYLAEYARSAGAKTIVDLPTAIDLDRYFPAATRSPECPFTVGWIGTPLTARYLEVVRPALSDVCAPGRGRLALVGSGEIGWENVAVEAREWSVETEVDEIRRFDVGIMPLPDAPFERGKCGYKLIQCMGVGLPVVASPIGVNRVIVRHGENGFLAETPDEWSRALATLRDDPHLRARMGRAARATVEERYCTAVTAPRLLTALRAAGRPPR